jgi:hypothetical protein
MEFRTSVSKLRKICWSKIQDVSCLARTLSGAEPRVFNRRRVVFGRNNLVMGAAWQLIYTRGARALGAIYVFQQAAAQLRCQQQAAQQLR